MRIKRHSRHFLFISFMIFMVAAAQTGHKVPLPNTPAAEQLEAYFQMLETKAYEAFVKKHFSKTLLSKNQMEDHTGFFRQVTMFHGNFIVHEIKESEANKIQVIAQGTRSGAWRKITVTTEPETPYQITGLNFERTIQPITTDQPISEMSEGQRLALATKKMDELAAQDRFSGAFMIAKNGKPLIRKAYGMASKRFSVPNNPETKFNLGSIDKSFTEVAIAQLLEQGKLSLDDTIDKYLDVFPAEVGSKVTILHLLQMKSGMGHYWTPKYFETFTTIRTVDELIEIIKDEPLSFEPGTKMQYSNSGFVVLGAIIEKISGMSYYDYVKINIFQPANMPNSGSFVIDQIVPNLAIGYPPNQSEQPYNNNKYQNNILAHAPKGSPAGGGYSTIDDLNNYIEALKAYRLAGKKYSHMAMQLFRDLENVDKRPPGLGIAGGAGGAGINAVIEADFDSGYTVIVMANYDPPSAENAGSMLFHILTEK